MKKSIYVYKIFKIIILLAIWIQMALGISNGI